MPYTQNTPQLRASTASQLYNLISLGVLNDFLFHCGDKENLIWNKSRNTFFIADNSNAFFFSVWMYSFISLRDILFAVCNVLIEKRAV